MSDKLELTVSTDVNGTRFQAVYEVKGEMVELTSPDFGDGAASLNGADPQVVAELLLRDVVEQGLKASVGVGVIMRDDEISLNSTRPSPARATALDASRPSHDL